MQSWTWVNCNQIDIQINEGLSESKRGTFIINIPRKHLKCSKCHHGKRWVSLSMRSCWWALSFLWISVSPFEALLTCGQGSYHKLGGSRCILGQGGGFVANSPKELLVIAEPSLITGPDFPALPAGYNGLWGYKGPIIAATPCCCDFIDKPSGINLSSTICPLWSVSQTAKHKWTVFLTHPDCQVFGASIRSIHLKWRSQVTRPERT